MQRERIGIIAVCRGNVRFDCVRNRVHTRMSNQLFGHGFRKIGIDDGHVGRNFEVRDGILDALCIIGDDGKRRHLGSRTRRRGNRAEMRLLSKGGDTEHFAHFFKRDVGIFVFDPHRFCGVDRRPAAETKHEVTRFRPGQSRAFHNVVFGRVGLNLVKHDMRRAGQFQFLFHPRQITVGTGRFAVGNDDQRLFARQLLFVQIVQTAGTEQNPGRNIIVKIHL